MKNKEVGKSTRIQVLLRITRRVEREFKRGRSMPESQAGSIFHFPYVGRINVAAQSVYREPPRSFASLMRTIKCVSYKFQVAPSRI